MNTPQNSNPTAMDRLIAEKQAYTRAIDGHIDTIKDMVLEIDSCIHRLDNQRPRSSKPAMSTKSDCGSMRSGKSIASGLTDKQTDLEASKIRLEYLKQESKIEKQIAELDTLLKIKRAERDIAIQEREINDLKESAVARSDLAPSISSQDRTASYINELCKITDEAAVLTESSQSVNSRPQPIFSSTVAASHDQPTVNFITGTPYQLNETQTATSQQPKKSIQQKNYEFSTLNPTVQEFTPKSQGARENADNRPVNTVNEFSRFLIKKDLILSRLNRYDDNPMHYMSWKLSFKGIMEELDTSFTEELDLLIRYLGTESSKQAFTLRACNAGDSGKTVSQIWERLDQRFGAPEIVESYLKQRIATFHNIPKGEPKRLYELADLVSEISSVKGQPAYAGVFAHFDSSTGVNPLVSKLPWNLQEKWTNEASKYKLQKEVAFPPFSFFHDFILRIAKMKNDPSFHFNNSEPKNTSSRPPARREIRNPVSVHKTETIESEAKSEIKPACPLHKSVTHTLNQCSVFRKKPIHERKKFVLNNNICFKCCGSVKHRAKNCKDAAHVKCEVCKSNAHPTALHVDSNCHEGEKQSNNDTTKSNDIESKCTQICGKPYGTSKSCAKIIPVKVYQKDKPNDFCVVYAIIDDQSSNSLASSYLFDRFNVNSPDIGYSLVSCAGKVETSGRRSSGYVVQSLDGTCTLQMPTLTECNDIPRNRNEIPTPDVAMRYPHLRSVAPLIPAVLDQVGIELLIGRDIPGAHFVQEQRTNGDNCPFAQRLPLGWVVIGQVCLGKAHSPEINVNKTYVAMNGRPTNLEPCPNEIRLFEKTENDERIGRSVEDVEFVKLMNEGFEKNRDGFWSAPLPFRKDRLPLPDNRAQAHRRAKLFDANLLHNPTKRKHVQDFMQKIFDRGHAEKAPSLSPQEERWYLPMFGVYHPRKPESIRVVFDSSAKHDGMSLNEALMKGPDLTNSLQGILLRFRRERVAVTADVEQMFHNFRVKEDHRNFLRFLWHRENDFDQPLDEFRMTVHVFGNSPSPAVATYGLRKSVETAGSEVQDFVNNDFYVDDGLLSCPSVEKAVDIIKRTQEELRDGGRLRLHKIASNSVEVLKQFNKEDLAKDLKNVEIGKEFLPTQRSLGVSWDINTDSFGFNVETERKPFTRRGVLSTINSLFDPLGFVAPVVLEGKQLLRDVMASSSSSEWDKPLDESFRSKWEKWVQSLTYLHDLSIPRMYCKFSVENSSRLEVHVFTDASKEAVAAVAYLKVFSSGNSDIGFLMGKAKVAPSHGHTIPRLELCAAVLGVEIAEIVKAELRLKQEHFKFHTDSQIVLGYIWNETKRRNPADLATRPFRAKNLSLSAWINGPSVLTQTESVAESVHYPLISPEKDKEVRTEIISSKTLIEKSSLGCCRFERFSEWSRLVGAIRRLKQTIRDCVSVKKHHVCQKEAERVVIRQVQNEVFYREIEAINGGKDLPKNSGLRALKPLIDSHGILRVGGRLINMKESKEEIGTLSLEKHPIIVPKNHHVSMLIIRHYHAKIQHQGRTSTEGAVRSAGFWVIGMKRMINSLISKCVTCRKLRGKLGWTQMADLPSDRLQTDAPFTYVGVDVFGPWPVVVRRTRGGSASNKRWALLFTCLVSRAIHVEIIEEMSSASFINALRRFVSIRGPVRQFRSDRGSNFIGAVKELSIDAVFVEEGEVAQYLAKNNVTWLFNPPHSSHFGGVWERLIGSCRRILDAMLLNNKYKDLTHETLSTFMCEVCAIVNSRPLVPLSVDPDNPSVLSPSMVLTQKPSVFAGVCGEVEFGTKDAIRSQWKLVQRLADEFWKRWRSEYIHSLQTRAKWQSDGYKFTEGDIVLLRDEAPRSEWPMGIIDKVFESADKKVRKVQVVIVVDGCRKNYVRPISELVQLIEAI